MIAKGNLHGNGGALARYLMTGEGQERAQLVETRGLDYLGRDPVEAFKTLQKVAEANTQCQRPFFHVQTRNPDGDKKLTDEQWLQIADREEKRLGLTGQPRIVTFHIDRESGERHMHVAWFRVDLETMRAIDPSLYKNHLKQLCRSLEKEYGLKEVSNSRKPEDRARAADRKEVEEARRLGTDDRAIRATILDCLERTDNGRAFRAALTQRGLMLANGDKRNCFVVIDQAGGHHALNKRLTGLTMAQMRNRLGDLDRSQLPSVDQAKMQQREKYPTPEQAREIQLSSERLHNIGGRYDPLKTEPAHGISNARDDRPETKHPAYAKTAEQVPSEKRVSPAVAEIHATWGQSPDPAAFAAAMRDQGYRLARVTPEESRDSHRAHASAKELGTIAPRYRDGEIVVVNDRGWTYRLNERSTGANRADIQKFAAEMKAADLPSLTEAKKAQLAERQKQDVVFKETAWHRRGISTMEIKILGLQEAAERGGAPVAAGLHAEGLTLARVDAAGKAHVERDNQQRYENDRLLGKADARLRQAPNEGELVVVNKRGMVFRLSPTFVETDRLERAAMTGNVQTPALSAAMTHFATERQRQKDDRQGARDARQTFWKEERADARLGDAIKRAPGIAVGNIKNVGFKVVDAAGKFMSLSSFVESLFGMGKAQSAPDEHTKLPPGPASDPDEAWEHIYQAVQQGRALPADAVRHLPPSDLENLRRHGDAHINDKILDMEREKERDETRGWEDHLGRELER